MATLSLVNHSKRWSKQKSYLGISACNHYIAMSSNRTEAPRLLLWQCHQHGHLIATGTIRVLRDPQGKKNSIPNLYVQNTQACEMAKYTCFLPQVSQALTVPSADEEDKK
jgi:hypothetical protein